MSSSVFNTPQRAFTTPTAFKPFVAKKIPTFIAPTPAFSFITTPQMPAILKSNSRQFSTETTAQQDKPAEEEEIIEMSPEHEKRYKRVIRQAEMRGWLELDLIFCGYVAKNRNALKNPIKLEQLEKICVMENSDLIRWFVERYPLPEEHKSNEVLVDMLEYAFHPNKPWYPKNNKIGNAMAAGNQ
eukprot:UN03058